MSQQEKIADKRVWVMTEGMIGTQNQCLGVCDALSVIPTIIQVQLKEPWKTFSPWLGFEQSWSFDFDMPAPYPDIIIAAGRKAIAAARFVKKKSPSTTILFLQNPKIDPKHFDLVAAPYHDNITGSNVIVTDGACNRINAPLLKEAAEKFDGVINTPNKLNIGVLFGGNSRTHSLSEARMTEIIDLLTQIDAHFMMTASRRTGAQNFKILQRFADHGEHYLWNNQGDNPYHAILALSDIIFATEDSVSMISDAATAGKPVYVLPLEGSSARFDRFHNHMHDLGVTRLLTSDTKIETWHYPPLKDTQKVADALIKYMGLS